MTHIHRIKASVQRIVRSKYKEKNRLEKMTMEFSFKLLSVKQAQREDKTFRNLESSFFFIFN